MINKLIENYDIYNFRSGDIFFAFLRIFSSTISEPQLFRIVEKHKNNKQTAGIDLFLAELHEINPTIFTERINKVIKDSKFIGIHV